MRPETGHMQGILSVPGGGRTTAFVLLAMTASACTLALFIRQGLPYAQYDMVFHMLQAEQFYRVLADGFPVPRWAPDVNHGFGGPNFIFYAPLSYYFASFLRIFFSSTLHSMMVAVWCAFFLSGVAMFAAAERMFGRGSGALASCLYVALPFHVIDLYARGSFAELFAYVWAPLVILFLHEIVNGRSGRAAAPLLALSYAGLILTHLVSGFLFSIVVTGHLAYNLFAGGQKRRVAEALLAVVLGLGVAAYYVVPVYHERRYVQIDHVKNIPVGDYSKNFLFTPDKFGEDLRSFYLPIHVGFVLELALLGVIALPAYRRERDGILRRSAGFLLVLAACSVFLMTVFSRPLWRVLPAFHYLQFPWRWMPVLEAVVCLLVAYGFSSGKASSAGPVGMGRRTAYYLLATFLAMALIMGMKSPFVPGDVAEKVGDPARYRHDLHAVVEYAPVWASDLNLVSGEEGQRVSVIAGSADIGVNLWLSQERRLSLVSSGPARLRFSTFYYPGWEARVDGRLEGIVPEGRTGAITMEIPAGSHSVTLSFVDTALRRNSSMASAVSLFLVFTAFFFGRRGGRNVR